MNKKTIILALFLFLALSAHSREISQEDIQRFSTYYANGQEYMKNSQYSNAIVEYKKVLRFAPADLMTQKAMVEAYLARAQYNRNTLKEYKKAINDYKSAVFYAKYWTGKQEQNLSSIIASASKDINDLEKKFNVLQDPESRLKRAKLLKAQGELAASGYEFQQLKNSKYPETVYKNLANIYKNLNNQAGALDSYKMAIDINPKNPETHFLYGVILDEVGNYEASLEQYNLAFEYGDKSPELLEILENKWVQNVANNPNDAQSYANLGAIYQKKGDFNNAKIQYLKAYDLDNNDETIINNLASLYNQQKDYQSAIGIYDKILQKKPNDITILNYKAQAYKNLNQNELALETYEKILKIKPNDEETKGNIGDILYNRFDKTKLSEYLFEKAKANPNSYDAQFNYAFELHKNKDFNNAAIYYKKAMELNPSKEEPYLNLSQIYMEARDYQNADLICQKGLMYIPNNPQLAQYIKEIKDYNLSAQYDSATELYNSGQYKKAILEYNKIQNKTKEVKLAIASCYWQLKDFKNANKYYLELLNQDPNNIELLESSAWAYYSLKDYENSSKMAQRALAINPQNKEMSDLASDIKNLLATNTLNDAVELYSQGKFNEALIMFNKILSKTPNDEYSIYYKGLCLDELKKPQEAMVQYKSVISKNPEFASAYYSLAVDLDNSESYKDAVKNYEKFMQLKAKNNESDEMTAFAASRIKELNEYLTSISKK